jgi:hypothetical protein
MLVQDGGASATKAALSLRQNDVPIGEGFPILSIDDFVNMT